MTTYVPFKCARCGWEIWKRGLCSNCNAKAIVCALAAIFFLSCAEPKQEALPLRLLKQKSASPCLNSQAFFHSDTMFIREFKTQDVRMIILCNACERSLETEKKIELYKQAWEAWGGQARRPDWEELRADLWKNPASEHVGEIERRGLKK